MHRQLSGVLCRSCPWIAVSGTVDEEGMHRMMSPLLRGMKPSGNGNHGHVRSMFHTSMGFNYIMLLVSLLVCVSLIACLLSTSMWMSICLAFFAVQLSVQLSASVCKSAVLLYRRLIFCILPALAQMKHTFWIECKVADLVTLSGSIRDRKWTDL